VNVQLSTLVCTVEQAHLAPFSALWSGHRLVMTEQAELFSYGGLHVWSLFPMSGLPYVACAMVLSAVFVRYGWKLYRRYSGQLARKAFTWTIAYLALLFAALPADHYCRF
jgi:heme O synthase-like polyprenyltransferase